MPKALDRTRGAASVEKINPAIALGMAVLDYHRAELKLPPGQEAFLEDGAGRLFRYTGRYWAEISESTAKAIGWRLAANPGRCTDRMRGEAVRYIRARCHREVHAWGRVGAHEVACHNGVVDARDGTMRPHRDEDYLESVVPWDYDPAAPHPALDRYLDTCFPPEEGSAGVDQRVVALQVFTGYVVLSHARFKKALVLEGPSDSGKTQFVLLLKELVGALFTCSLSVEEMDDPVARSVLVGKRLNVLTELPADAMIRDGGFKTMVSTEDPFQVNPKYLPPFMLTSAAKHVIATNDLPRVNDRTAATFNRLLVVPYTRVIPVGERDKALQDKFRAEMPGILAWAIEGAKLLIEAGGEFPPVELALRRIERMREESNPVWGFVDQMMVAEDAQATPLSEITKAFNAWHAGKKLDIRQVARLLRARLGGEAVRSAWHRDSKATAQALVGWRLRSEFEQGHAGRDEWILGDDDAPAGAGPPA